MDLMGDGWIEAIFIFQDEAYVARNMLIVVYSNVDNETDVGVTAFSLQQ